jgi:hypothetical protein
MTSLPLSELRPYLSLVALERRADISRPKAFHNLFDEALDLLGLAVVPGRRHRGKRVPISDPEERTVGRSHIGAIHYETRTKPRWWPTSPSLDITQQLLILYRRGDTVLVFATEPGAASAIVRALDEHADAGVRSLIQVPRDLLQGAFAVGPLKRVWLAGVHRPTTIKPDSKEIVGSNLIDAMDPVGDQSYYPVSLSSVPEIEGARHLQVGLTAREARMWAGFVRDWDDFCATVDAVVDHLEHAREDHRFVAAPIPFLATPVIKTVTLDGIYDIDVVRAGHLVGDNTVDPEVQELAERWATYGAFEVLATQGAVARVSVKLNGTSVGLLDVTVTQEQPGRARVAIKPYDTGAAPRSDLLALANLYDVISVRFDSGFTVTGGEIVAATQRDAPFESWDWVDFTGYNIGQEKPWTPPASPNADLIGTDPSLFSWVQKVWPDASGSNPAQTGWLVCDDGAQEMADFIHFDPSTPPRPTITLIHVKGALSESKERQISTSAYELVESQAVKNLRWLERGNLMKSLTEGRVNAMASAVWHDGKRRPDGRNDLARILQALGQNYDRQVVIVQPHLRRALYEQARQDALIAGAANINLYRMRQLDALLLGIQRTCASLGARTRVIAALV